MDGKFLEMYNLDIFIILGQFFINKKMDNYSVKDFINDVFNPFYKGTKHTNKYHKYVYIIRLLILTKISLIFSLFLFS